MTETLEVERLSSDPRGYTFRATVTRYPSWIAELMFAAQPKTMVFVTDFPEPLVLDGMAHWIDEASRQRLRDRDLRVRIGFAAGRLRLARELLP